jgi:hypothetical protein
VTSWANYTLVTGAECLLRAKIDYPMNREYLTQLHAKPALLYHHGRQWAMRVPVKARVVLGLFLAAAVLMAMYSAFTAKDATLHLRLQHGFHNAQVSVWVDGDFVYSGKVSGSIRKRFGLIPTASAQGSLSQVIPVRSGQHNVRVRIEPDDAAMQEDSISGDFTHSTERGLSVSARRSGLSLSWQGTGSVPPETSSSLGWFSRYADSFFLTIAGSIMSALTGFAIKELPARLRSTSGSASKAELGPQ